MSVMNGYEIEVVDGRTLDYGFGTLACKEPLILSEGERSYQHRVHGLTKVSTMRLQGLTSNPKWNKWGEGKVPSFHFKVLVGDGEETWNMPVAAFREAAEALSGLLQRRQVFISLKGDIRHTIIPAAEALTGVDTPVTSLALNFEDQARVLAIFAPRKSTWAMGLEALSKKAEGEIDETPF